MDSPDDYRLLICDGHDSHISAEFVDFAMKKKIEIVLLPPHSSHLLQPLDVAVFSPLKKAVSSHLHRLMRAGTSPLEKAEWLEYFAKAREDAITKTNVLSGWRGAGIFPENRHRILSQLPDIDISPPSPNDPPATATEASFLVASSPPDPMTLHNTNRAFINAILASDCATPIKNHARRLGGISERLQADNIILRTENKEMLERQEKQKERQSGKRLILKGKVVISTEEVRKALADAEAATKAKKKRKMPQGRKRIQSSDEESQDMSDSDMYVTDPQEVEMSECIEVSMR